MVSDTTINPQTDAAISSPVISFSSFSVVQQFSCWSVLCLISFMPDQFLSWSVFCLIRFILDQFPAWCSAYIIAVCREMRNGESHRRFSCFSRKTVCYSHIRIWYSPDHLSISFIFLIDVYGSATPASRLFFGAWPTRGASMTRKTRQNWLFDVYDWPASSLIYT